MRAGPPKEVRVAVAVSDSRESIPIPPPVTATEAAALEACDVFARLGSGAEGLAGGEAARRLRVVGPNAVRSYRARWRPVLVICRQGAAGRPDAG